MMQASGFTVLRKWNPLGRHTSLCAVLILLLASPSRAQGPVRERISFNKDWRFAKSDPNSAAGELSYNNIRAWVLATGVAFAKDPNLANRKRPEGNLGADVAYTQPEFDDKLWRSLTLPHDWGIEGPFDPKAPGGTGKLPFFGIGWYRKHFTVPAFVTATIVDRDGTLVPRSRNRIRFSIDGPGEIVATDNGDPTSFESFQAKERNAFNGLCLAIVRAKPDQTGTITLRAQSEGLKEATVALRSEAVR